MKKIIAIFAVSFLCIASYAQNIIVKGVVTDSATGESVPAASVMQKGTTNGTMTDIDGKFEISVPANSVLSFSSIGYKTLEVEVNGRAVIDVVLDADAEFLDEVVVTAMGISREKKALGYSVTEVGGEEMLKSRGGLNNPVNALQGKVAGLQISSGSGSMGGSSKILIRGVTSISGSNQPLFVIDGVPIEGKDFNTDAAAKGSEGYDYGNLVNDINPDDIETISVLKGASASALYGSRANNGVILITTKSGKAGENEGYGVSFTTSVGFERVNKLPLLQRLYGGGYGNEFETVEINGKKYLYPDMGTDESWGPKYDGQQVLSWYDIAKWEINGKKGDPTTSEWKAADNDIDKFFETGVSFVNNVAVSKSTERVGFRVSFTNSTLKGYLPNSNQQKNILNLSGNVVSADKKLEAFSNVNFFNSATTGRSEVGYGDNNVLVKFVQWGHRELDMAQLKELYRYPVDGSQITWNRTAWNDPTPAYSNNPYWSRYMNYQNDTRFRIYGNIGASYKILPTLTFSYKANLDFFVDKQYERHAVGSQEQSAYSEASRQQSEVNHEFLLTYKQDFSKFTVNALVGANLMRRNYEYLFGETVGGLAIQEFYNLKNSIATPTSKNEVTKKAINSVFASAGLGYNGMLFLDATVRADQSSTLPNHSNLYVYPSVTGSFVFSELLKNVAPWYSFGKLRLGYAIVGNDTDPYQVYTTYSQYTNIDSTTPGYRLPNKLMNLDLKSESTTSFEVGLESNFFNDRLGFDITYYNTLTKDQIIPLSLSGTTGYIYKVVNSGKVANKGLEIEIHGTPVETRKFTWTTSLSLASNKNKVVELIDGVDYYKITSAPFKVEIGAKVGSPYGVLMGTNFIYDKDGNKMIDPETGLYLATDGNEEIGTVYPDFTGGWSNTFRIGNFDCSILLDFSKGGHFFSTSYMWGIYSGMLEETAADGIRENGIVVPGVIDDKGTKNSKTVNAVDYCEHYYNGPAAQNVLKSDYIKLREVNAGYTIPIKSGKFVKGLRVSAYGRNLAIWGPDTKHFDPEVAVTSSGNIQGIEGGVIAGVASFGFSANIKF